jgi:3-phytase
MDLAVTTERHVQRLRAFRMPGMEPLDRGDLTVFDGDTNRAPMGIALYVRPRDGALFAIVGGKSGPADCYLWQYRLDLDEQGMLTMKKVRSFGRYSGLKEIEAIAVDSELGYVYYSDEKYGLHKYQADPDHPEAARELAEFGRTGFACDIEGISIYRLNAKEGYLIVSNQQADTFRIFPREGTSSNPHEHPLVASVRLSTLESDGNDVTSLSLPGFPGGLFVAMSTDRTFHYYAWSDIAALAKLRIREDPR